VPAVAPVRWVGGWPRVDVPSPGKAWGKTYGLPRGGGTHAALAAGSRARLIDEFAEPALGSEWEWNHNPDVGRFNVVRGLVLKAASVTDDLYAARNTLTSRIPGPVSTVSMVLDVNDMRDGDDAGLVVFRDSSSWIGVQRRGIGRRIVVKSNITMDVKSMATTNKAYLVTNVPISGNKVWLRATVDVRPGSSNLATYKYSTDGTRWQQLGFGAALHKDWGGFFMGYRFGVFNYATKSLGGSVRVERFEITTP
jgi:beta-xylosidase